MGDDPNAETFVLHARHGEADTVNRHRTFEHHITHHVWRRRNVQQVIVSDAFPLNDFPNAINMSGDKMSAEFATRPHWPLQIHQGTGFGELQIRPPPGFREEIELDEFIFPPGSEFYHGEAAAVYREAVAEF